MLEKISDSIAFYLIKNRVLDIEKRELYTYGIEVILLNGSILLSMLIISLLLDELIHYLFFAAVFCSLRITAGGYHARTAGRCFLISNGIFLLSVLGKRFLLLFDVPEIILVLGILSIIGIFLTGPVERQQEMVSIEKQHRHKKKLNIILLCNLILLIVLYVIDSKYYVTVTISLLLVKLLQGRKFRRKAL
ncbi:MAG: accessory gene regulator B family protein [Lachnospiraceae bacterium]|nr:accessory gene regulator B family protein [Lachnospiraceae bacterium]